MIEKERKYLLQGQPNLELFSRVDMIQGYLALGEDFYIRIRYITNNNKALFCYKKFINKDSKYEFEYGIDGDEAKDLISSCIIKLNKTRYSQTNNLYETCIDVYEDGSSVVEIELLDSDCEFPKILPWFVGEEVTNNKYYSNIEIAKRIENDRNKVSQDK